MTEHTTNTQRIRPEEEDTICLKVHGLYKDLVALLAHPDVVRKINELSAQKRPEIASAEAKLPPLIEADLTAFMRRRKTDAKEQKPRDASADHALGAWQVECWISANARLGPLARLVVLMHVLFPHSDTPDDEVHAKLAVHFGARAALAQFLQRHFHRTDPKRQTPEWYLVPWPLHRAMALTLNGRDFRNRLPSLTHTQIMEVDLGPVEGPRSIQQFEAWLRTGIVSPTNRLTALHWTSPRTYEMYKDLPGVSAMVSKATALVISEQPSRPIIHLVSRDRLSVLKVVGTRVAEAVKALKGWHVVWLTATRTTDLEFRNTLRDFLTPLAQAFAVPLGDDTAPLTSDQLARIVDAIRRGLTRTRCLVVVEGLQCAAGRGAPLLSYLSGVSEIEDLVRSLCLPHIEESLSLDEPQDTCRSRFLLLATQASQPLACLTADTLTLSDRDVESKVWNQFFPKTKPDKHALERQSFSKAVRALQALGCTVGRAASRQIAVETGFTDVPEQLLRRFSKQPRLPSDVELAILVAWHSLDPDKVNAGATKLSLMDGADLMRELLDYLKVHRPEDVCVLAMLACVPDGLFPGSLKRIFRHWRKLVQLNVPGSKSLLDSAAKIVDSFEPKFLSSNPFLLRYGSMLSLDWEQIIEHLGPRQLRWEVDEIDISADVGSSEQTSPYGAFNSRCSFSSVWLRQLFIEQFRALDSRTTKMESALGLQSWWLLQFCAAGECQRQGTALLRNAETGDLATMSRYRRLLQCIHHILAAGHMPGIHLPTAASDANDHQLLLFPGDPDRREAFAFAVLYRQLLEQEGRWRLSRGWGRSELRVALLTQFLYAGHQPQAIPTSKPRSILELAVFTVTAQDESGTPIAAVSGSVADVRRLWEKTLWTSLNDTLTQRLESKKGLANKAKMYREFMANLVHAANDAEDHQVASFALDQMELVASNAAARRADAVHASQMQVGPYLIQVSAKESRSPSDDRDWEAAKLRFDLVDGRGGHAGEAKRVCLELLSDPPLNLGDSFIALVHATASTLEAAFVSTDEFDFESADEVLMDLFTASVAGKNSARERLALADILGRWADVLSNTADTHNDVRMRAERDQSLSYGKLVAWDVATGTGQVQQHKGGDPIPVALDDFADAGGRPRIGDEVIFELASSPQGPAVRHMVLSGLSSTRADIAAFLPAWVVYWTADAVRASVGVADDLHGTIWGNVSSKFYRTGIRTTLKLARLKTSLLAYQLSPPAVTRRHLASTRWMLNFAQSRADVLARDVHMHSRERLQAVLLQSAMARTLSSIERDLRSESAALSKSISARMHDAVGYVASAERRLLALGSPTVLARRLSVERIQVLTRCLADHVESVSNRDFRARRLSRFISHDLETLQGLATPHPFWISQYERHRDRFERLRKKHRLA